MRLRRRCRSSNACSIHSCGASLARWCEAARWSRNSTTTGNRPGSTSRVTTPARMRSCSCRAPRCATGLRQAPSRGARRYACTPRAPARPFTAGRDGFSLNAAVACKAEERRKLQRLCRYVARPPVALQRLSRDGDGLVVYELKRPLCDGSTHVCCTWMYECRGRQDAGSGLTEPRAIAAMLDHLETRAASSTSAATTSATCTARGSRAQRGCAPRAEAGAGPAVAGGGRRASPRRRRGAMPDAARPAPAPQSRRPRCGRRRPRGADGQGAGRIRRPGRFRPAASRSPDRAAPACRARRG